jgi:hypothetical protein
MTKIIQFPKVAAARAVAVEMPKPDKGREGLGFFGGVRLGVWMLAVLMWPLLRWIAALDVFWQFCRMVYHWDTPGVYAGWQFLAHFAVLVALHYYVGIYRPKGAPERAPTKFSR